MAMTKSSLMANAQTFSFLSMPVEIRYLVYRHIFTCRSIVLRDKLDPPDTYICGRRYWHFYLADGDYPTDSTLAILLVCRQISVEAQPLLQSYTPSHLILSKNLQELPTYVHRKDLDKLGLPWSHITHLRVNAKCFGDNKEYVGKCPGMFGDFQCHFSSRHHPTDDRPPPDPERLANLEKIYELSDFLRDLASLRELHIYDVLKHSLSRIPTVCECSIARTPSCACEKCHCVCLPQPPLPNSPTMSVAETRAKLHESLLIRFRAAVILTSGWDRRHSNYHTVLDLIARGVRLSICEEVAVTVPLGDDKVLRKGTWHATYRLVPCENARLPAEPPTEVAETPKQRRARVEREEEEKKKLRMSQGKEANVFDFNQFLADTQLSREDIAPNLPEGFTERPLREFEAGLGLELADEGDFDTILDPVSNESPHNVGSEVPGETVWK